MHDLVVTRPASGLRWLWLTLLVIIADQVTKLWVADSMSLYQQIELLPWLNLTYVHNPGAAFSFLSDAGGWQRWFFSLIAVAISGLLVFWLRKLPVSDKWQGPAFALIIGGALGNLIDRALHGHVVDFIDFHVNTWHWPAFNIADSAIVIAAFILVLHSLLVRESRND